MFSAQTYSTSPTWQTVTKVTLKTQSQAWLAKTPSPWLTYEILSHWKKSQWQLEGQWLLTFGADVVPARHRCRGRLSAAGCCSPRVTDPCSSRRKTSTLDVSGRRVWRLHSSQLETEEHRNIEAACWHRSKIHPQEKPMGSRFNV